MSYLNQGWLKKWTLGSKLAKKAISAGTTGLEFLDGVYPLEDSITMAGYSTLSTDSYPTYATTTRITDYVTFNLVIVSNVAKVFIAKYNPTTRAWAVGASYTITNHSSGYKPQLVALGGNRVASLCWTASGLYITVYTYNTSTLALTAYTETLTLTNYSAMLTASYADDRLLIVYGYNSLTRAAVYNTTTNVAVQVSDVPYTSMVPLTNLLAFSSSLAVLCTGTYALVLTIASDTVTFTANTASFGLTHGSIATCKVDNTRIAMAGISDTDKYARIHVMTISGTTITKSNTTRAINPCYYDAGTSTLVMLGLEHYNGRLIFFYPITTASGNRATMFSDIKLLSDNTFEVNRKVNFSSVSLNQSGLQRTSCFIADGLLGTIGITGSEIDTNSGYDGACMSVVQIPKSKTIAITDVSSESTGSFYLL